MASLAELNAEGYNDSSDYVTCPQKEVTVVVVRCVVYWQCRRCMGGSQLRGSRVALLSPSIAGLVIERSRVRIPAGAAGEFSSPGSTF